MDAKKTRRDVLTILDDYTSSHSIRQMNGGSMIRTAINTSEIVYDIHQGLNEDDLKRKYNLTTKSLGRLMKALARVGVLEQAQPTNRTQSTEIPYEFTHDCPACGSEMDIDADKCAKCGASVHGPYMNTSQKTQTVSTVCEEPLKAKSTIESRILEDIRAGMDDRQLIKKYRISSIRIVGLLSKFLWDGSMTVEEFEARRSLAKTVYMPSFSCPSCKEIKHEKSQVCPDCGSRMTRES